MSFAAQQTRAFSTNSCSLMTNPFVLNDSFVHYDTKKEATLSFSIVLNVVGTWWSEMTVAASCYGVIFVFGLNMTKLIFPIKRNVLFYGNCKIVVFVLNEEIEVLFYGM